MLFDDQLLAFEESSDFSWDAHKDGRGLTGTDIAERLTAQEPDACWIFDAQEKIGGSEFSHLCRSRVNQLDHMCVGWPGSWIGITVGRAMRTRVFHGHGARFARDIVPWRDVRMALPLRDPKRLLVSWFQMQGRFLEERNGLPAPSLEEWITFTVRERGDRGFNRQIEWIAGTLQPRLTFPHYELANLPEDPSAQLDLALQRLETYDLVAATENVGALFEHVCHDLRLELLPVGPPRPRPANASPVTSASLIDSLSPEAFAALCALTEKDQILFETAQLLPNWFSGSPTVEVRPDDAAALVASSA